jgi:hypothetical protein
MRTGSEIAVSPGPNADRGFGGVTPKRVRADGFSPRASNSVPTSAGVAGICAVSTIDVSFLKV